MPISSIADFQGKVNAKAQSSATLNPDSSVNVQATHLSGATAAYQRVIVNTHTQSVTIGDGSGVRTGNADQFLNSLK